MFSRFLFVLATIQFWAGGSVAAAAAIDVTLKYVIDGDTIVITFPSGDEARARLCGIDAPEKNQKFGSDASTILKELLGRKHLSVEIMSVDRYDRLIVNVFVDDVLLNRQLVANGAAWVYPRYANGCWEPEEVQNIFFLQESARNQKIGLWREVNPDPPWEYRRKGTDKE